MCVCVFAALLCGVLYSRCVLCMLLVLYVLLCGVLYALCVLCMLRVRCACQVWPEVSHMVPVVVTPEQLVNMTQGQVTYVDGHLYAVMYRGFKLPTHIGHWVVSMIGLLTAQMQARVPVSVACLLACLMG